MSVLNDTIEWFKSAISSASDAVQSWSQEWQNAVDNFKQKAKDFIVRYETLQNKKHIADQNPELKADYDALMSKGNWLYDMIVDIARKLDWINDSGSLQGMGIIQLVPIAIIVGALAAMSAWMFDSHVTLKRIEAAEAAIAQGGDPSIFMDKPVPLIDFSGGKLAMLAAFAIVGIVLWPQFKKALK